MKQMILSGSNARTGLRHLVVFGAALATLAGGLSMAATRPTPTAFRAKQSGAHTASFNRSTGVATPGTLRFEYKPRGHNTVKFAASTDQPWLALVGSTEWSVSKGEHVTVVVAIDEKQAETLPLGTHTGRVELTRRNGRGMRWDVELLVEGGTGRVSDGLVALYDFEEGSGAEVHDTSGVGSPLNLEITDPGSVTWTPGSLRLSQTPAIVSPAPATKVIDACKATDEVTIEAWVTPAVEQQSGPARIVTLSGGSLDRNATLAHGNDTGGSIDAYTARLRATSTSSNGTPGLSSTTGTVEAALQHVIYTRRSDGLATIYVDGAPVSSTTVAGNLDDWDNNFRLALGNEVGASRPWSGSLHLVAVYDRALDAAEVSQNLAAGTGDVEAGSLAITPLNDFAVFGTTGSDLSGESMVYEVANSGTETIDWSVSATENWVQIDGLTAGSLAPGGSASVTLRLDASHVATLTAGQYTATVNWTNSTNGLGTATTGVEVTLHEPGSGSGEKPGPHNTGPSNPAALVPTGTITADVDGMVIENVDVNGIIRIEANNVTIRNFRIDAGGNSYGIHCTFGTHTGTLIEDGEIRSVDSAALIGRNFTARRLNIHHSGGDGIKAEGNVLVEGCWIHHLGMNPGAHADGNQTRNGSNIVFRGNNIDMPEGLTGFRTNAAFIIQDETGPVSNFLIEGNWLNGGNYTIMLADEQYGGPSNITILNNRFGRDYRYGTLTLDGLSVVASGNVWDDTGAPMSWNTQ